MKKLLLIFSILLLAFLCFNVLAASVTPELHPGNDSNPNDYTPPTGCIHFEIPGSSEIGTYTVRFNNAGGPDPAGTNIFTVTVGKLAGKSYTQVLFWSSNFPINAVIVKGGDAFNLYPYPSTTRQDTDLVSPINASGHPADVSHVSIVICPGTFPTSTPTSTPTLTPTIKPTSTPCPPKPPVHDCALIILLVGLFAFIFGVVFGVLIKCICDKKPHCR